VYKPTPIGELDEYIQAWQRLIASPDHVTEVEDMQRTGQQNKALHKYCAMVADEMNAAGYDFKEVVRLPVSMTPELVKEYLFKRIMSTMYPDKESTTELDTVEIQAVYENMNNATGQLFSISMDWPSEESMSESQR